MRVAIVNDLGMAVEALRRVAISVPEVEIAWTAGTGAEAWEKCKRDTPELVLMDLIMPVMDGVEATQRIMETCPCPILVVTATVDGNASRVYEALGYGALDAVNTPSLGPHGELTGAHELVRKIRTIAKLANRPATAIRVPVAASRQDGSETRDIPPLVAIGSSTGGPRALSNVLQPLGRSFAFAVVVVQHLDPLFVPGLVEWLAREANSDVRVAEPCQCLKAGTVYVACTADHLRVNAEGRLVYTREPVECAHRPSVDVFFESLLHARVKPGVAVLLTGMGRDGAWGMKTLREAGWDTIVQDEATSVIWGMPGAAVQLQAAKRILPIDRIGPALRAIAARAQP